jgi:amidophosphoribosyltransferase
MIRQAGAKEVHMRISSPPTTHSCLYGIDTPTSEELIASHHTLDEIRDYMQADSLAYLSYEGMMRVAHAEAQSYCSACFTGQYPVQVPRQDNLIQLSLFDKQRL